MGIVRALRWGTFIVLLLVVAGAAMSYPLLRDRFLSPVSGATTPSVTMLAAAETVAQATNAWVVPTALPATAPLMAAPTATLPAVIISAPSPTPTPLRPDASPIVHTHSIAVSDAPIVVAIATTSLLPPTGAEGITLQVLGPDRVEDNPSNTGEQSVLAAGMEGTPANASESDTHPNVAVPVTPPTPTPTLPPAQPPAPGQKGAPPESNADESTVTPIVVTQATALPIAVTPVLVTTVQVTPSTGASDVTPIVVTTIELTPQPNTPTPRPIGPTANTESPLYAAPDPNSAVIGVVRVGEPLVIVGMYTEGTWYLLVNGEWIPGALVNDAPLALPLVVPTMTPAPTNTPTVTPTPSPTATPLGSATPTPTPTSLDLQVCDCSGDTLDCLGNIFANRAQAQQCFEYCFRQTGLDIHLLDPNLNGMACENLP